MTRYSFSGFHWPLAVPATEQWIEFLAQPIPLLLQLSGESLSQIIQPRSSTAKWSRKLRYDRPNFSLPKLQAFSARGRHSEKPSSLRNAKKLCGWTECSIAATSSATQNRKPLPQLRRTATRGQKTF